MISKGEPLKGIVIYTAIFGSYDQLTPPTYTEGVEYICFTDNPKLTSRHWKIIHVRNDMLDPAKKAREIKLLPHKYLKDYKYSIWVDANISIMGNVKGLVIKYLTVFPVAVYKHNSRNCIYEEAKACIKLKKDDQKIIQKQMNKYKSQKYPENNGLIASGVIIRDHHNSAVKLCMEEWWSEVLTHSKRDQLSFNYIAWRKNLDFNLIQRDIYKEPYFKLEKHKKQ